MSPKALAKPKAPRGLKILKMQGPPAKVDDAEKKMSPVSLADAAPPPKVEEPAAAQDEVAKGMLAAFDDVEAKDERQVLQDAQSLSIEGSANVDPAGSAALGGNANFNPAGSDAAPEGKCKCVKCKLHKEVKGSAVASPHFVCRECNCKRATCSQVFGHWPIDLFTELSEEHQTLFWQSDVKGKAQIQNALVNTVVNQREEEQRTSVGGTYLPLSVLEAKGFDGEKIKNECKDTEEHAFLGTVYNVGLKTVTRDDIEKKVWKDLFRLNERDSPSKKDKKKKKR